MARKSYAVAPMPFRARTASGTKPDNCAPLHPLTTVDWLVVSPFPWHRYSSVDGAAREVQGPLLAASRIPSGGMGVSQSSAMQ